MSDPLRWTDAKGGAPAELRTLLHHAKGHAPPLPEAVRSASALAVARITHGGAWWAKKYAALKVLGAVAFVAAGSVVGVHVAARTVAPPAARRVQAVRIASPPPSQTAPPSLAVVTAPTVIVPVPVPVAVVVPAIAAPVHVVANTAPSDPGARPRDTEEESARLEEARGALSSGDVGAALAMLHDHARRYPRSELNEERDYLEFRARAHGASSDEIAAAAGRFLARHPNGIYSAPVRALAGSSR